ERHPHRAVRAQPRRAPAGRRRPARPPRAAAAPARRARVARQDHGGARHPRAPPSPRRPPRAAGGRARRRRPRLARPRGGGGADVRVSIVPTAAGERVVLRLLDRASVLRDVGDLGLSAATTADLASVLECPHGLFLVTGPTGSGKTTTLYALLQRLANGERNI